MNCFALIIAAAGLLIFSAPARAAHSGPYIGAYLGGNLLPSATATDNQGSFRLSFNPALQAGGVLGWDITNDNPIGEGRVELEYTHRSNRLDQVGFVEGKFPGDGHLQADSVLLSSYGGYHSDNPWIPYLGAGIGAARVVASGLSVTGQPLGDGSAVVLAYQLGCGVELELTRRLRLDLGYRYFGTIRPEFTEANGSRFKLDYTSHSATLGLLLGF